MATGTDNRNSAAGATTAVAATCAAIQLGAVVAVVVARAAADAEVGDRAGVVPLGVVYGLPPVLALMALRRRDALLLVAGIASLILAVVPFSLHSFLYAPVAVVYLVTYGKRPVRRQEPSRAAAAALVVPLLLVAAFLTLVLHEDPICYARDASGEVTIERQPDASSLGTQTIEPDSTVVERGCSSDTVVWWEAAASLVLSAGALAAALLLVPRAARPAVHEDATAQS